MYFWGLWGNFNTDWVLGDVRELLSIFLNGLKGIMVMEMNTFIFKINIWSVGVKSGDIFSLFWNSLVSCVCVCMSVCECVYYEINNNCEIINN